MPRSTNEEQAMSDTDRACWKSICSGHHTLWYQGDDKSKPMICGGAPAHLVVHALDLLAPMVEATGADATWASPEYLREIMSHPSWDVVCNWVRKIDDDIYMAEKEGLI
jgi:hypothetical protein